MGRTKLAAPRDCVLRVELRRRESAQQASCHHAKDGGPTGKHSQCRHLGSQPGGSQLLLRVEKDPGGQRVMPRRSRARG